MEHKCIQWPAKSEALGSVSFYVEELLAPRPSPNLEDKPLSAVRICLFNILAATHPQPEYAPCRDDRDPHNMADLILFNV